MTMNRNLILGALLLAACSHPLEPTFDPETGTYAVEFNADGNLLQRVVISSASPAKNAVLTVTSTIYNAGVTRPITSRICGLDLEGLAMIDTEPHCAGFSMQTNLATNDSIMQGDRRTITAAAGDYTLRVRHLLQPDRWVELKLHVK